MDLNIVRLRQVLKLYNDPPH
ncbi:unnamed protein product, partial [Rotaria socialis]